MVSCSLARLSCTDGILENDDKKAAEVSDKDTTPPAPIAGEELHVNRDSHDTASDENGDANVPPPDPVGLGTQASTPDTSRQPADSHSTPASGTLIK